MQNLEFHQPDLDRFPGLGLAFDVLQSGDNAAVVFNAANEIAVDAFLRERIGFLQIPSVVSCALEQCERGKIASLDDVLGFDRMTREKTDAIVKSFTH
jgi:1-deoxy-D-xylulose-5-phosphate reductoisomerase